MTQVLHRLVESSPVATPAFMYSCIVLLIANVADNLDMISM